MRRLFAFAAALASLVLPSLRRGRRAEPRRDNHDADQARRHADAGQPLLRQLLRHLSGCRRHPDRRLPCRSTAAGRPAGASSRSASATGRPTTSARPSASSNASSTAARWTASSPPTGRHGPRRDPAMGYYDDRDIPYYWNVADNYVLFDRFFTSATVGSVANHMYWVAGSAAATSAEHADQHDGYDDCRRSSTVCEQKGVSWKFYVAELRPARSPSASPGGDRGSQPADQGPAARATTRFHRRPAARRPHRRPEPVLPRPAQRHAAGRVLHRHRRGPASTRRAASGPASSSCGS